MKKILLILFVGLFQNFIFGATITSTATGGNWNSASSWVGGVVPTASDDVVIVSGSTITVDGARSAKTLDIRGILLFNTNNTSINLPAGGTVNIVSPGKVDNTGSCTNNREINIGSIKYAACQGNGNNEYTFDAINASGGNCPTSAGTLSGNQYICRYGTMTTTLSSTISGGTWSSSNSAIASVNATSGLVTSTKPDDGVSRTVTITYTVGGTGGCTVRTGTRDIYVANGPANGPDSLTGSQTQCQSTTTTYTITPDVYSSSYIWTYEGTGATITPAADGLSASVTFSSTATSGNMRVQSVNGCGNGGGGKYLYVTINPIISAVPVATSANNIQCTYAQLNWNTVSNASGYYLDIAKDSGFTNFVTGFNNFYVPGNNSSYGAGNLPEGVLYYRVRGYNSCTTTANSNTVSFQTEAPVGGSVSPAQTICTGSLPTSNLTLSGYTAVNTAITNWQSASDAGFTTNVANISETTNVLSIAKIGVLTANTYFRAVVQNQFGSWCVSYSSPVLITVNNSISAASSTPTVCINTAITSITHTTSGFTGIGSPTNLPAGVTASFASNIITISGTPSVSGTFNYSIPLTGGSCAANATGTITVNALNTIILSSAVGTDSQTKCINTAITNITYTTTGATGATFSGLPTGVTGSWAANVVTISGTPTVSGTFNYIITLTGGCGTVTKTGTIDVAPTNTITLSSAVGTDSQTKCINTAITNITYTTSGAAGATFSGLPAGVTGSWAANVVTISGTPTVSGTFNYTITLTGGCGTVTKTGVITIDSLNAPSFGTITSPTCAITTGSVVLTGLPAGSWTLNRTGTSSATTTGTGSSVTVSGLGLGTYTFTVSDGTCTSSSSLPLNITESTNTWDGVKWSKTGNTTPPISDDLIVFEGNYTSSGDLNVCSCTVNSGIVTILSDHTLNITNAVKVNGGSLTFENNASLVQTANVANTGSITYKRTSAPMKNFDYTYWSSPVAGQTLFDLSPNTLFDKYFSFSGTNWQAIINGAAVMQPGIGYIIRTPKGGTWPAPHPEVVIFPYSQPVQFKGVPNNGNITSSQSMVTGNFYLIGNPYPSALSADDFLFNNSNNHNVLNGTIYLWTHNTAISSYKYTSDDYASYNQTGGTATIGGTNNAEPSGYIAAGQSFFASAKANGTVEFNNSMRPAGNNTQFFKPGKTSKTTVLEKHRLWLNMTNATGAFKQTLIGYIEGATNAYDDNFDGLTFDGNSFVDLYSINGTNNLTIQGRALPFKESDVVPLGYRSTVAGDFTIAIKQADGVLANQKIYLEDKQTGTINDLTSKNYTFTTTVGTFNNRFVLRYTNTTLGTGDFETVENSITILSEDKTIKINSAKENIDKIFIYDVSGKQLYNKQSVGNAELVIPNLPFAQQVLLVKIILENDSVTTKKLIFK